MARGNRIPMLVLLTAYAVAGAFVARPLLAAPGSTPGVNDRPVATPAAGREYPVLRARQTSRAADPAPAETPARRPTLPTRRTPPGPTPTWAASGESAATATAAATATPTTPPPPVCVLRTCPIDGDSDLLPLAPVHIVFDQAMDTDDSALSVTITPSLPFWIEWLAPEHLLVQTAPRQPETQYRLTLGAARSLRGAPLAGPLSLSFGQGGLGAPIPILMYHHVDALEGRISPEVREWTVSPQQFVAQLDLLSSLGAHVVSLAEAVDYLSSGEPLPARPVVLTFDDANACVFENAVPILQARGLTATFFVSPAYIGSSNFMDWAQLKALADAGFALGAHGFEHVKVHALSTAQAERQFGDARRVLEAETGARVTFFAYPYGWFSSRAARQLAAHGYRAGLTINPYPYQKPAEVFTLSRIRTEYGEPLEMLREKLPWE